VAEFILLTPPPTCQFAKFSDFLAFHIKDFLDDTLNTMYAKMGSETAKETELLLEQYLKIE